MHVPSVPPMTLETMAMRTALAIAMTAIMATEIATAMATFMAMATVMAMVMAKFGTSTSAVSVTLLAPNFTGQPRSSKTCNVSDAVRRSPKSKIDAFGRVLLAYVDRVMQRAQPLEITPLQGWRGEQNTV